MLLLNIGYNEKFKKDNILAMSDRLNTKRKSYSVKYKSEIVENSGVKMLQFYNKERNLIFELLK